jgi:hypothetical protein
MIVLKKIDSKFVEKTIPPGGTEAFFDLDLSRYNSFDWEIKILSGGQRGVTKVSSLFNDDIMESTAYAFLGKRFNSVTNIFVASVDRCKLEITNNESTSIQCSVKLKTF